MERQEEQLLTSLVKKLKSYFKESVNIILKHRTKNQSMFRPTKERKSWNQKANATYIIECPDCRSDYVGKTGRNVITVIRT